MTNPTPLATFLARLAVDATELGNFILDPEPAMTKAGLSSKDKEALRSSFADAIEDRLKNDQSIKDAWDKRFEKVAGQILYPKKIPDDMK